MIVHGVWIQTRWRQCSKVLGHRRNGRIQAAAISTTTGLELAKLRSCSLHFVVERKYEV